MESTPCCSAQKDNLDLKQEIQQLRIRIQLLEGDLKLAKQQNADVNVINAVKGSVGTTLTPNQVDLIMNVKNKALWTEEEMSRAFTLRYFSVKGYDYLRINLNYPLPCYSTLNTWASKLDIDRGFFHRHLLNVNRK